jgi:pimeloyl-ACP methyl ester carboxylesterase
MFDVEEGRLFWEDGLSMIEEAPFRLTNSSGWWIRGEVRRLKNFGRRRAVVICHGFKGFKDWGFFPYLARRLAEGGFTAVTFNFSGNGIGESPLDFTEPDLFRANTLSQEVADLEQILEALARGELPGLPSGFDMNPALLGHSRGGLVSLVVARRRRGIDKVVTWASVGLLENRFPEPVRADWRRRGYLEVVNSRTGQVFQMGLSALDDLEAHIKDYDPANVVAELPQPYLIVHGTSDQSVPFSEAEALFEAGRKDRIRLLALEGGDHTFGSVHPFIETTPHLEQAIEASIEFLATQDER